MRRRQWLGPLALFCQAAAVGGWALISIGLHNGSPGGAPAWGNRAAIAFGLLLVVALGALGTMLALAALSERPRWVARVALAGNALSLVGAVSFVAALLLGAHDP